MKKMEFKAEVKELLDLMIHSLYSHKEIFLRELISNSSDAIDRLRIESLTNDSLKDISANWKIKIISDKTNGTLTVSDNGIGMSREEIIESLGTIAHSGTKEFISAIKSKEAQNNPELIGQFGVGFYSSFMVSDKVTVLSRRAGEPSDKAVKWESSADGSYSLDDAVKDTTGTDIILKIKEEEKKYLEEWEIKSVVKKYSDFIEHPVVIDVETEKESSVDKTKKVKTIEEETINSRKAIWLKRSSEVTQDEYNEFYQHISHDYMNKEPFKTIHFKAEGTQEFSALLYIPKTLPFNIFYRDYKFGPKLYVKRVQITEHCEELIWPYLRFIQGVVDSSDLPLNVSREILQHNSIVERIKKSITKKALDILNETKKEKYDDYLKFYNEFGKILKEGIHFDHANKETIGELLLFHSTKTSNTEYTTLNDYISRMKEGQEHIYYITSENFNEAVKSPYLEIFREKDYEVLVLTDEIDDFIFSKYDFKEKRFKSITKEDLDLKAEKKDKKTDKEFKDIIGFIKEQLIDNIKDVKSSSRLKESACCLVADSNDLDPYMQNLFRSMGQNIPDHKKTLEINTEHPLIKNMNELYKKDKNNTSLKDYIKIIYDEALILEGSKPKDPAEFAQLISKLMTENAQSKIIQ